MITKSLIAAAAIAISAAGFTATSANAGPDIDVYLSLGGGYGHSAGYGYPIYDEPIRHGHRRHIVRVSCEEGAWNVRDAGFRRVRANDCSGRTYTYTGKRHGDRYLIKVSSRSGDIVSTRPLY